MKKSIYILLLLPLTGCFRDNSFSDDNPKIETVDVIEILLTRHTDPTDTIDESYSLKDKKLIEQCVSEMNGAELDGPWKGAGWDHISIVNKKDTIVFSTNGSVFGIGNSGTFYRFDSKEFYLKYWGIKAFKN